MSTATAERFTAPVSVRERGYADTAVEDWYNTALREATPELRWPASIDVYDSMRKQDAQVSSVLRAIVAPITQTTWRVDGSGCDPVITLWVASNLGLPVVGQDEVTPMPGRQRFNFTRHLQLALLCLPFGHMYFEQVYAFEEDAILQLDDGTLVHGLYRLRKLGPRMHRTIAKVVTAKDGGLVAIEQYAPGSGGVGIGGLYVGGKTVRLPVNRLVAYVYEQEGSDWLGTSVLRPVFKNWLLKDDSLRAMARGVRRNSLGIPVYEASTDDPKKLDAAEEVVGDLDAGDDTGVVVPPNDKISLMGVAGSTVDPMPGIRYHDEQIARAVLAHFLSLGGADGGHSYALGATLQDWFALGVQSTGGLIRDTTTLHVVEDLVDLNFGPDAYAPKLVFDDIGSKQDAVIQAIAYLVSAGVLHPDESLEHFVRTTLGVPAYNPATAPVPEQEAS